MVKCWEENPHDRLEFTEIVQELGDVASELLDSQNRDDPDKTNGNERTMLQGECV